MPVVVETLWVDVNQHSVVAGTQTYTSTVLTSGSEYRLEVVGNFSWWINGVVPYGAPDTILVQSGGQAERPASMDGETIYGEVDSSRAVPRHTDAAQRLMFNTGSGWTHVEPEGGPYSSPQPGHAYTYVVIGEGQPLGAALYEPDMGVVNGQLRLDVTSDKGGWVIGRLGATW